ncbi:putative calcium-binding protein CML25 [Camellia lanceoleosa]|uniref:Calcium-binding protein CML25 n=1 Tax=Camellia lanceoleosa TaxID=1840588 RepID=A0ACC0G6Z6_9ERIC|nr:putative calcium-binding protein CML25 [Camellia lanceoleosa]
MSSVVMLSEGRESKKHSEIMLDAEKPVEILTTPSLDPSPAISRSSSRNSRAHIEEELKQVFNKFDVNGDGKISSSELGSILSSLGYPDNDEELQTMIREVDSDGDRVIDLDEFIELNTKDIDG